MKNHLMTVLLFAGIVILPAACGNQPKGKTPEMDQAMPEKTTSTNAIADAEMGLSKTSVFDTPEPQTYTYSDKFPGTSTVLPRAYLNAPPQIPHNIESFKPITASNNACIGCHTNPALWGKTVPQGTPTPIPESHYTDLRNKPNVVGDKLVGARYVCTQCHVPQANVKVLVENSFKPE